MSNSTIINGHHPATKSDIEDVACIAMEQAQVIELMFKAIARLTSDTEILGLCKHGAAQAFMQSNDLDCMREQVKAAGFAA